MSVAVGRPTVSLEAPQSSSGENRQGTNLGHHDHHHSPSSLTGGTTLREELTAAFYLDPNANDSNDIHQHNHNENHDINTNFSRVHDAFNEGVASRTSASADATGTKKCPLCGKKVPTGSRGDGLAKHMNKGPCNKRQIRNEEAAERARARALFTTPSTTILRISQTQNLLPSGSTSTFQSTIPDTHFYTQREPRSSAPPFSYASPSARNRVRRRVEHRRGGSDSNIPIAGVVGQSVDRVDDEFGEDSSEEEGSDSEGVTVGADCNGVLLDWPAGSVFTTYPWQEHTYRNLPWNPIRFDDNQLWIRERGCLGVMEEGQTACLKCKDVLHSRDLLQMKLLAQADNPPPNTQYKRMNHVQKVSKLEEKNTEINRHKLQDLNAARKVKRLTSKLDDHKRLVMAIATHDIQRVHQLMRIAIKQGRSPREIVNRILKAAEGVYHVRGYSETDLDLARLMKNLAGAKGLYALSHALGLPSRSTINRLANRPLVLPSPAFPEASEIAENIGTFFGLASENAKLPKCGHGIMIDGIHCCQRVRWLKSLNMMCGLCREHVKKNALRMLTVPDVLEVADSVHGDNPTCHFGKEATVAAVGRYCDSSYHPEPIMVSMTCKSEKAPEFAQIVQLLVDGYEANAKDLNGPLWTVATDGDSLYKKACHEVLMCSTLAELDSRELTELFELLRDLKGLNLGCSKTGVVHAPDPKHLLKRIATLLRSNEGVFIDGMEVNRSVLTRNLLRLPDATPESVENLMNPADHQNVPRAVELIEAVSAISKSPISQSASPTELAERPVFTVLGELWDSYLLPFITPNWSLSQQLRSLAKFAHLAFAMYSIDGPKFMASRLYGDAEASVKSIFFCVGRQQILDGSQPFHIFLLGTDRLEGLFGEVRTSSHDRSCDVMQLTERLRNASENVEILTRNTGWDRGHRRISYRGGEGVDHVNPRFFTGDLTAKNACLKTIWMEGREAAVASLASLAIHFNFSSAFSRGPDVDFLRPMGGDEYPGVSLDVDRSEDITVNADEEDPEPEDLPDVDIEEVFSMAAGSSESAQEDTVGNQNDSLSYVENGKPTTITKTGLLSKAFHSTHRQLSQLRQFAVQGKAKDLRNPNLSFLNSEELSGKHNFNIGDIAICPIRSLNSVSLALIKVNSIERKSTRVCQIDEDDFGDESLNIQVTGQILVMRPEKDISLSQPMDTRWLWTGDYSTFDPLSNNANIKTRRVQSPGHLIYPIDPDIESVDLLSDDDGRLLQVKNIRHTWALTSGRLKEMVGTFFEGLELSSLLTGINKYGASRTFPYRDEYFSPQFPLNTATEFLSNSDAATSDKVACYQCGQMIKSETARAHVGKHILRARRGVVEQSLIEQIHPVTACGFCGRPGCNVSIIKPPGSRAKHVHSLCTRSHRFSYAAALKPSYATASTNVPIACELCQKDTNTKVFPIFWKYDLHEHIRASHPRHWNYLFTKPAIADKNLQPFAQLVEISDAELEFIGIPRVAHSSAPLSLPSGTSAPLLMTVSPPPPSPAHKQPSQGQKRSAGTENEPPSPTKRTRR